MLSNKRLFSSDDDGNKKTPDMPRVVIDKLLWPGYQSPSKRGRYCCDVCNSVQNTITEMIVHIKKTGHPIKECPICEFKLATEAGLLAHVLRHDDICLPFFCEYCSRRFKNKTSYQMHIPIHSSDRPFVCEICCASFKWKHVLNAHHASLHNSLKLLCDKCGFSTAHRQQLNAHELLHTGDVLDCPYTGCDYRGVRKQNMKLHLLTHTKEKSFQCDVCGQSFSLQKNLKRHMLRHSDNAKQYHCTFSKCNFNTLRCDKMREHLYRHHRIGKRPKKKRRYADMLRECQTNDQIREVETSIEDCNIILPINQLQDPNDVETIVQSDLASKMLESVDTPSESLQPPGNPCPTATAELMLAGQELNVAASSVEAAQVESVMNHSEMNGGMSTMRHTEDRVTSSLDNVMAEVPTSLITLHYNPHPLRLHAIPANFTQSVAITEVGGEAVPTSSRGGKQLQQPSPTQSTVKQSSQVFVPTMSTNPKTIRENLPDAGSSGSYLSISEEQQKHALSNALGLHDFNFV